MYNLTHVHLHDLNRHFLKQGKNWPVLTCGIKKDLYIIPKTCYGVINIFLMVFLFIIDWLDFYMNNSL